MSTLKRDGILTQFRHSLLFLFTFMCLPISVARFWDDSLNLVSEVGVGALVSDYRFKFGRVIAPPVPFLCGTTTANNWGLVMKRTPGASRLLKILFFSGTLFTLYHYMIRSKSGHIITVDSRLGPAWTLLENNELHPDDLPELSESTDEEKMYLMSNLRQSVDKLISKCKENVKTYENDRDKKLPLLTLFTSWSLDRDKLFINNRTLFNWRTLPEAKLVVFYDSSDVKYYSKLAGFEVIPVTEIAAGAPILPAMFSAVKSKFKSEFYGFANGDILFTNSLIKTLETIQCRLEKSARNKGLLIVGRRVNIPASFLSDEMSTSWSQMERIAAERGDLFITAAEDYFITDSQYPWQDLLPVVIGRRGYDNWVVAYSRYHNITVIDATESIFCLHQTLESRGNFEGAKKGRYNVDLIEKVDVPFNFAEWGLTICAGLKTWVNLCGEIVISERKRLQKECTAYYFSYRFYRMLEYSIGLL